MFKVICIDDKNRPDGIPISQWVKKNDEYTVIKADFLNAQNRVLGFKLEEKNIDSCFPYQYFAANRFRPKTEDDVKAEEAVQELLSEELVSL